MIAKLEKLLIFNSTSPISAIGNVQETVWRIYTLMYKGVQDLYDEIVICFAAHPSTQLSIKHRFLVAHLVKGIFKLHGTLYGDSSIPLHGSSVDVSIQASVQAALSMDRTKVNGRPMFVSPSVDKSKNPTQFKVSMRFFSFILSMHRQSKIGNEIFILHFEI